MFSFLWNVIYNKYLYYIFKCIVHIYTGKCGIERIIESPSIFPEKVLAIEQQCVRSKNCEINQLFDNFNGSAHKFPVVTTLRSAHKHYDAELAVTVIQRAKNLFSIITIEHLRLCLKASCKYQTGIRAIEKLRRESFDDSKSEHTSLLETLWCNLGSPEIEYSRISKNWQLLGFQGTDPSTDFRGMGLLGLMNLVEFSGNDKENVRRQLSLSQHPLIGYSFSITGIDMTNLCYQLFVFGKLKKYFYSKLEDTHLDPLIFFHETYALIFSSFGKFWFHSEPTSIMDYGPIRQRFETELIRNLELKNSLILL